MKIQVKAGRYVYDPETKKVKPEKEKGIITVYKNQDDEVHFSWANTQTKIQDLDMLTCASDAVFESVEGKNNTYVLKFTTFDEKYFFWFQQKVDAHKIIKDINNLINEVAEQNSMEIQKSQKKQPQPQKQIKPSPMQVESQKKPATVNFIRQMQQHIQAAKKKNHITHLSSIINQDSIKQLLKQSSQTQLQQLSKQLPPEHQDAKYLDQNIKSPQFQQALDVLSDALNSQNCIALFMDLKLDRKYLHNHYGVEAFIRALDDWGKQQPKQEQKPKQK